MGRCGVWSHAWGQHRIYGVRLGWRYPRRARRAADGLAPRARPLLRGTAMAPSCPREETVDELRARLKDRVMYSLYLPVMEELRQRGADVRRELPVATTLLAAETAWERHHGWRLLRCFFPDVAATIPDYDPAQPAAQCRAKVASIRSSTSTPAGPK